MTSIWKCPFQKKGCAPLDITLGNPLTYENLTVLVLEISKDVKCVNVSLTHTLCAGSCTAGGCRAGQDCCGGALLRRLHGEIFAAILNLGGDHCLRISGSMGSYHLANIFQGVWNGQAPWFYLFNPSKETSKYLAGGMHQNQSLIYSLIVRSTVSDHKKI